MYNKFFCVFFKNLFHLILRTVVFLSKTFYLMRYIELVQPRKTGICPNMTENLLTGMDVKHQN